MIIFKYLLRVLTWTLSVAISGSIGTFIIIWPIFLLPPGWGCGIMLGQIFLGYGITLTVLEARGELW